ncbi:MAG: spore cortex biosynthesis protein YabQ [Firmicutes bacterium]|nr:spore cortex biosynthesis protein YabQ [Bacillota bacterium]
MNISVGNQLFIFAACGVCGVVIAFVFDVFRIIRRFIRTSVAAAMVQDAVYWIIAVAVFFIFIQGLNSGELRLFEFLALLAGTFFYFMLISALVIKISIFIISFIIKIVTAVLKVALWPVIFVFKLIGKPLFIVFTIGKRKGSKIIRKISQDLLSFNKFRKRI